MGAEGVDGLAGEVVVLQEGVHRHGHGAAVVGIAQVNFVIAVQIGRQPHHLRPCLVLPVLPCLSHAGLVVVRVGHLLLDVEPVAAGQLSQHVGHLFRVAYGDAAIAAAEIVLSRTGVVCNQTCHNRRLLTPIQIPWPHPPTAGGWANAGDRPAHTCRT